MYPINFICVGDHRRGLTTRIFRGAIRLTPGCVAVPGSGRIFTHKVAGEIAEKSPICERLSGIKWVEIHTTKINKSGTSYYFCSGAGPQSLLLLLVCCCAMVNMEREARQFLAGLRRERASLQLQQIRVELARSHWIQ